MSFAAEEVLRETITKRLTHFERDVHDKTPNFRSPTNRSVKSLAALGNFFRVPLHHQA